jgi:hypothetical protein
MLGNLSVVGIHGNKCYLIHAMPRPCRSHAMPCRVNSHTPCRAPTILRQCRVLRESPRGSRKNLKWKSYSLSDWYVSDSNLRGTPHGSRKRPKADRPPTCRRWTADANSHMLCRAHAAPMPRCALALRSRVQNRMAVAWARYGMCETNTIARRKSNGKDKI